jgi:tellurite resistance protein
MERRPREEAMEAVKGMLSQMKAFEEMIEQQKQVLEEEKAQQAAEEEAKAAAAKKRTKLGAAVDAAYLICSADGTTSPEEMGFVCGKVALLTDGNVDHTMVQELLREAAAKCDHDGRDGCVSNIANTLETQEEREAAFMVAAAVSWQGGGISTKEGLALQAISGAFGWEMGDMHKLLGKARVA